MDVSAPFGIPYRQGGKIHPMYPDMLIVEKTGDEFAYSILEPHDPSRTDNVAKTVGLAEFAEKHQLIYHCLQLIRKKQEQITMSISTVWICRT